jgi:uncharacterized protein GlcG (DUF336 family)
MTAHTFSICSAAAASAAWSRDHEAHACVFKRPTKSSEEAVMGGRLIHLALPGVIPAEGGVPLLRDGVVIGGIGVSGVRSPQDGQIALAGVAAL